MKTNFTKPLLTILLALTCAFVVVGASILIYNELSQPTESSTSEDDGWTDNY